MSHPVRHMSYAEDPQLTAIVMLALLFKLGGQVTLSVAEIYKIQAEFPEIRIAAEIIDGIVTPESKLTFTLRSLHMQNDRPQEGENERYDGSV